jgi:hypothetical protein
MDDKSSILPYHDIRLEVSVRGTEDIISELFGFTERVEKIHHRSTGFETDFCLVYIKQLDESAK